MKRFLALMLSAILMLNLIPVAFAAEDPATAAADELNAMGLFSGTGTDANGKPIYELGRAPTRQEAVTMLVRLLGKEAEAKAGNWDIPFTDVAAWAKPYVGYAYANGLTNGTSATTFGSTSLATATQYLTFVLRALGYESGKDFQWNAAWELTDKLGITNGEYTAANNTDFLRGDIALISCDALDVKMKGQEITLLKNIQQNLGTKSYSLEDYTTRKLTDAQIRALRNADLDTLCKEISTIGDAVAWLDQFEARVYDEMSNTTIPLLPFELFTRHINGSTTALSYVVITAWCITDDFDGVQYVVSTSSNGQRSCTCPALALPTGTGDIHHIISPGTLSVRKGQNRPLDTAFRTTTVNSLESLEHSLTLPWSGSRHHQIILADANQQAVQFSWDSGKHRISLDVGSAKICYAISEEILHRERVTFAWDSVRRNFPKYGMPDSMKPTLSKAQLEALMGKDIDTVAASLKTLGDCLYYYALSGYTQANGDLTTRDNSMGNGVSWHYNYAPEAVFSKNTGNCGASSGLTSYLLKGDYPEMGILSMTFAAGNGGGHVINYIRDGASYYVFDIVGLVYSFSPGAFCFSSGATLQEAAQQWIAKSGNPVRLMWAYQTFDGDLPIGWDRSNITYLPAEYKDKGTILIETPEEGYLYQWTDISDLVWEQIRLTRNPVISRPDSTVPIDKTENYMTRILSDKQLEDLKYADADTLQTRISTVWDAVAYLDQFESQMFDALNNSLDLEIEFVLDLHRTEATGPDVYTFFTGWCLADDYPESRYLIASASNPNGKWIHHGLLLPSDGGYQIINPARHSERWSNVFGFDEGKIRDLSTIESDVKPLHAGLANDDNLFLYHLFAVNTGTDRLRFLFDGNFLIASGSAEELYRLSDAAIEEMKAQEKAKWDAIAKDKKISDYRIPAAIGEITLSYEEAYALVGQDPSVIAEKVKSVADALQYMIAARFGHGAPNAYTPWYGSWGFDAPGDVQLEENYGCCCGGYANTASYLLQGDFEKVGTLRWVGGGNHTISWVYTGGKYYVFDFTQYCNGGNYNNYNCPVTVLDRLEDFYDQMPDTYSYFPKSEVVIMVAFEAGEAMYPSNWADPPRFTGLTFPTEAEGKVITIFQKDPRYGVKFADVNTKIPGWNAP